MDTTEIASFIWYIAFMLVPIIPAVIIYKLFPATQVGANGMLGNLKINATGAFAAYIITALLGFLYVKENRTSSVPAGTYKTWEVSSSLLFLDKDGKPIRSSTADSMTRKTNISLHPGNIVYQRNGILRFLVTARNLEDIIVNYSFPGFSNQTITLADIKEESINKEKQTVTLGTITMNEEEIAYMAIAEAEPVPAPEQAPAVRPIGSGTATRPAPEPELPAKSNAVVKETFDGPPLEKK